MSRPQPIAEILSDLMARRGYAREQSSAAYAEAWRHAVGDMLAAQSRVGRVFRGKLEVNVTNSTLVHELNYRKSELLEQLRRQLPGETIHDLKLRVGSIT